MKKVLITGGTGFIGSNFVNKFLELGDEVNLIVRPESNFWRIESVKSKTKLHLVDLTNAEEIERFIGNLRPQIILHFATYGAYQGREQDIKKTIDTNLLGMINLVNACSKISFDCFINTGSSSEYGTKDKPMNENDLLEPNNLYGVTKAAATIYCQSLAKKMELPLVTMRPFSVYGYFEEAGRLVPEVIKAYFKDEPPSLGTPSSVRDFVFVEDVIDAYLKAIENIHKVKSNIFNIGTGVQSKIGDVAEIVGKIAGSKKEPVYSAIKPNQHEPKNWLADISKARKMLDWSPKHSLQEGLIKTVSWFKENIYLYQ